MVKHSAFCGQQNKNNMTSLYALHLIKVGNACFSVFTSFWGLQSSQLKINNKITKFTAAPLFIRGAGKQFPIQSYCKLYRDILTGNNTNWHGMCTDGDRSALRVISMRSLCWVQKAKRIRATVRLRCWEHYRIIFCCATRLQITFFHQAMRILNSSCAFSPRKAFAFRHTHMLFVVF